MVWRQYWLILRKTFQQEHVETIIYSYRATPRMLLLLKAMVLCELSTIAVATSIITIISYDTCFCPLPDQTVSEPVALNFRIFPFILLTDKGALLSCGVF